MPRIFAEFCGTHFLLKNHDLEGSWCPDLPRALQNSGWCFSNHALEIFKTGKNLEKIKQIDAESALSFPTDFAGILLSYSDKWSKCSLKLHSGCYHDNETSMLVDPQQRRRS